MLSENEFVCECVLKIGDGTDQKTQKVKWHVNIFNIL